MSKKRYPLGLLSKFNATKAQLQKLEIIEDLDLSTEKESVLHAKTVEPKYIDLVEREFKRYLALPVLFKSPDYPLVPSLPVDALWHQFILNTPKYRQFCDSAYGQYLDHRPEASRAKGQAIYAGEVFAYTTDRLTEAFGRLALRIWGDAALCGPCDYGGFGG